MFTKERLESIAIYATTIIVVFVGQCYIKEISSFIDPYRTVLFIASIVGLAVSCLDRFQYKKWALYVSLFSYTWLFNSSYLDCHFFFEKYEWMLWTLSAMLLYFGIKYNIIAKLKEVKFPPPRFFAIAGCYVLVFLEVFFKIVRYL